MIPGVRSRARARLVAAWLPLLLLVACGGSGDPDAAPPATCSVADQKDWLGSYVNDWYLWYALAPRPDPAPYVTAESYYRALLYTGSAAGVPADTEWKDRSTGSSSDRTGA